MTRRRLHFVINRIKKSRSKAGESRPISLSMTHNAKRIVVFKELLGFDEYQLLSHKGIERFWYIEFLTYNYLEYQRQVWEQELLIRLVIWFVV
ncbi:hypothetical protein ACDX66_05315 [Peribacillus frigoritolerans]